MTCIKNTQHYLPMYVHKRDNVFGRYLCDWWRHHDNRLDAANQTVTNLCLVLYSVINDITQKVLVVLWAVEGATIRQHITEEGAIDERVDRIEPRVSYVVAPQWHEQKLVYATRDEGHESIQGAEICYLEQYREMCGLIYFGTTWWRV